MKKSRKELKNEYSTQLKTIKHDYHIQPNIVLEYLYMEQDNKLEAKEMLEQEIQRSLLYGHSLSYSNYSETVDETIKNILNELH